MDDLIAVARVVADTADLLREEEERLHALRGRPSEEDGKAGSPAQTLQGAGELRSAMDDELKQLILAIGFTATGLDDRAAQALRVARIKPITFPSGVDRMARPLGERVLRAMDMVREIAPFFDDDLATRIDVCLAAGEPSWPPADWAAYDRQRINRPD